ncbi:LysR family transcriptional regulator (plasmid) [Rhizobium leguminosarum]|uniref:LysR family transcriptional regulator n=1 Tax=Rhizobium leguminosarum TaxID=384 RepID=UPI001031A3A6|nr:LysR family transcriptional regulator [Rhizobium leguminosarum]TAU79625.1 LysR family transcriptional regulator [Rhizobium leguminosarum]
MTAQISIDRLTGLIAFARAASLGNYTSAARSLGVSPSAISKSVHRLEVQLGLRLFARTTRSLTLTPEGRDLHEKTLRLLQQAEEIEQTAKAARSEPSGTLRITAPLPIGVHILAPAIPRFRALYPKVYVELRLGDRHVDLIEESIDVAVRVGELADSRRISKKLGWHRIGAFASPDYLDRRGRPLIPDDLNRHDCVTFRYQSSGQLLRWPFKVGAKIIEFVPEHAVVTDASDAVAAIAVAGGGICISPTYVAAPFVKAGLLVPVLAEFAVDLFPITALWPESRRGNPNVNAFVAFLQGVFPAPAPWDVVVTTACVATPPP